MALWQHPWWNYGRALVVPVLLWGLVVGLLWEPVQVWLNGARYHDQAVLREWIEESVGSLPAMAEEYLDLLGEEQRGEPVELALIDQRDKLYEHLRTLGHLSKMHADQIPLFLKLFRVELRFADSAAQPITWDSNIPADESQYEEVEYALSRRVTIQLRCQLHAYYKRQREESQRESRIRQLSVLALFTTALAGVWVVYTQRRERQREQQRALAQAQVNQAERLLLQEELRRQEAERRQQQAERDLLQQRLAAQQYEQKMLELKSQLYASIGIMAGSYAHNIKNLLVRPNDLLRRCLEADNTPPDQRRMMGEVRQTLGTVTERLQQILSTVRRDPSRSEAIRLDLGVMLRGLEATWKDLALEKWKLELRVELSEQPLGMEGDLSHLQQAVENLLFNARDATFEMRNQLREEAHREDLDRHRRRQALIEAAGWKGRVVLRAYRERDEIVLEVSDNGIGMTEEVIRRCTETHFSTKRDNAAYEGHNTGMGLGLSFVQVVLDNHKARLEIESKPSQGTTFRVRFAISAAEALRPSGRDVSS